MSQNVKDNIIYVLIIVSVITLFAGLGFGFIKLLEWRDSQWEKEAETACKQIVDAAGVKEYKIDDEYNCYFVKDGKIITVKDW